jgi:hypothetical protein
MKLLGQLRFGTQLVSTWRDDDDYTLAHANNAMLNKHFKSLIINAHKK